MSKIDKLFGVVNFLDVFLVVLASHTDATRVASFSLGETLTVKFKAIDFGALAALLLSGLARREIEGLNSFDDLLVLLESGEIECG